MNIDDITDDVNPPCSIAAAVAPTYNFWAPWIAPSCANRTVLNTEARKCPSMKNPTQSEEDVDRKTMDDCMFELLSRSPVSLNVAA